MPKTTRRPPTRKPTKAPKRRPSKRKTLADLNAWMRSNHDGLLKTARANSLRLTGKPTFGGTNRRKSA